MGLWGFATTGTLFGPVPVDFSWDQSTGFQSIRTVDRFAANTDPPYDRFLNNPLIVVQVKPRISKMLRTAGLQSAKGRLEFNVAGFFAVTGLYRMSESSFVEGSPKQPPNKLLCLGRANSLGESPTICRCPDPELLLLQRLQQLFPQSLRLPRGKFLPFVGDVEDVNRGFALRVDQRQLDVVAVF